MVFIKKLVMHGFKSFVRKTEIPFTQGINVIVGPNGSGKSNVADALCFVLGRLSSKSMRAAKAGNLIFFGTKEASPAKEAVVELVFDNSDKIFTINSNEVTIKRIVRKNGQSIYKLNDEVKTRQEILSLLAQAGIDPNGFNIIQQGEIQNFVRMHNEERRKIIEEVSGISVYESRKEKSLHELEKTDEKLKEVLAILRERTSYLNNLERERQQALKFKKLELDSRKFTASIISGDLTKKKKELEQINKNIQEKNKEIEKVRKEIAELQAGISSFESKISSINSEIQKSTGIQQEALNQEIANIRAELAGKGVKLENYETKKGALEKQKQDLKVLVNENEASIRELSGKTGPQTKKEKDVAAKKKELEKVEEERKKFYMIKSELKSVRERIEDKKSLFHSNSNEAGLLVKQMEAVYRDLFDRNASPGKLESLKISLADKKHALEQMTKRERELEKIAYSNEKEIEKANALIEKISKMDICPVCKSKITRDHMEHIHKETFPKVDKLKEEIKQSDREIAELYKKKDILAKDIEQINLEISKREADVIKLSGIEEKKNSIKNLQEKIDNLKGEISGLEEIRKRLEKNFDDYSNIEQKYETVRVELQEISLRTSENVSSEISFKQRELERAKISLKQMSREEEDLENDIQDLKDDMDEKHSLFEKKKHQEEELSKKFQRLISERDSFGKRIRENEIQISSKQNTIQNVEQVINNFKIEKAKADAVIENLEIEMLAYDGVEIIRASKEVLSERLAKTQESITLIGTVNMRALEVYDSVKNEYDAVKEKTDVISKEKESIMKIIQEIDIKKKKTFMKTLNSLNEIFARNFSQISMKGHVSLDLENPKEPFEPGSGVQITVKTGHGKYLDVTSLSGGEQTLVAISLIFAIQELNPYHFYILDEIDAALDKRNSERLASLLNKYMQKGQYIVISHNDEIISNATNIYGVSMHDGLSKVISLKL
ncbi:MAG: chromosome segregation SMC family protein [Candidatus Pacearchaeota archaeon]